MMLSDAPNPDDLRQARQRLLGILREQGIHDERILAAIDSIPREQFVPAELRSRAYENTALPIGGGQTISQPYTVACMLQLLEIQPGQRILEIGGGSGYAAAVISRVLAHGSIYSVERIESLADSARRILAACDCRQVEVIVADGSKGLPEQAPFDRIIVAAEAARVPPPLIDQLKPDGLLLLPLHSPAKNAAVMTRATHSGDGIRSETHGLFRFVPLIDGAD